MLAARRILLAARRILLAARRILLAARRILLAPRRILLAPRRILLAAGSIGLAAMVVAALHAGPARAERHGERLGQEGRSEMTSPEFTGQEGRSEMTSPEFTGQEVRSVRVTSELPVRETDWVRDLAQSELVGSPFDPVRLQDTLALIYSAGRFRDLPVRAWAVPGGVELEIGLVPRPLLGAVSFHGNRHVADEKLARALGLERGMPLEAALFPRLSARVTRTLRREGFPDAQVELRTRGNPADRDQDLEVRIQEGEPLIASSVAFEGLGPATAGVVRQRAGLAPGDRLGEERLGAAIAAVRDALVEQGYPAAIVGRPLLLDPAGREVLSVTRPGQARRLRVVIPVQDGPKVDVRLAGVLHFTADQAREALTMASSRVVNEAEVERSARSLQDRYRQEGFLFATVRGVLERRPDAWLVRFEAREGPQVRLAGVRFEGARSVPADRLREAMKSRPARPILGGGIFQPDEFREDLQTIRTLYRTEGFDQVKVEEADRQFSENRNRVTITVRVDEGPRTILGALAFRGNRSVPRDDLIVPLDLPVGRPLNRLALPLQARRVEGVYHERGFPDARVTSRVEEGAAGGASGETGTGDGAARRATVVFEIDEGRRRTIGPVVIRGLVKTRADFVRRTLALDRGQPYRADRLMAAQRRLRDLGIFRRVTLTPLLPERFADRRETPLLLAVVEADAGYWSAEAGYGDREGVGLAAELRLRNVAGVGRRLHVRGELGVRRTGATVTLESPRFLDTRLVGTFGAFAARERTTPAFTVQEVGATAGLEGLSVGRWAGGARYEYGYRSLLDLAPEVDPSTVLARNRLTSSVFLDLARDRRDDLLNPSAGSLSEGTLELATPILGGLEFYLKPGFAHTRLLPQGLNVIALRGAMTALVPLGRLPSAENRLFAGGPNSIRGYAPGEIGAPDPGGLVAGGLLRVVASAEYRFGIWGDLGGVAFLDAGGVWSDPAQVLAGKVVASGGAGLRYRTPIGPLRLDYAHRLTPRLTIGAVHVGLGHAF